MSEDLQRIGRYVSGLAKRERLLIAARIVVNSLALALALMLVVQVSAWLRLDRSAVVACLVIAFGVAVWWVVAWPLLTRWVPAGDQRRQAELVEGFEPTLRGRLLTAVDRVGGEGSAPSPALLALVARRAARAIEHVPPAAVHPARALVARAVIVAMATVIALPVSAVVTGPMDTWRWWTGGEAARAAVERSNTTLEEEIARVGDLYIKYTYPAYTGLEPKIVPNSTGDVSGPPGTQVALRARTANPVEAAGLVAYEQRLDAGVDDDGRQVDARFTVQGEPGSYHLELYRSGEPESSREFAVTPQDDLPPSATLDAGDSRVEVALDGALVLQWVAADDYGISRADLLVDERSVVRLAVPESRRAEVMGAHTTSPRELGLRAGDVAMLVVEAWDNDTWSGSKAGRSRPVELVVLGPTGVERRSAARQAELVKALVPVLAEMLTDPWPPGDGSGQVARWGEVVGGRYEPLMSLLGELLGDGVSLEARLLRKVVDTGQALIRYSQVAFEPEAVEVPSAESLGMASDLRDDAIVELETALVTLIRMKQNRALSDLMSRTEQASALAQDLTEMFASEEPDALALLSRVEQLEQLIAELMEMASRLNQSGLQEFVQSRGVEMSNLLEEIRQALSEGRLDDAQELMRRLAQQLGELETGVQENLARSRGEADDSMEQADDLIADLQVLEKEQRDLQAEVQDLREQQDDAFRDEAADLWEDVIAEAEGLSAKGKGWRDAVAEADLAFHEVQRAEAAVDDTERLRESAVARDLRGTVGALRTVEFSWDLVYRAAISAELSGRSRGPQAGQVIVLKEHILRMAELLRQLDDLSGRTDPATQERSQQLESRQRELDNRLQQTREQAEQVAQEFPVEPRELEESLESASGRMQQASEDLGSGRPMEAEGSQGVAAERIKNAREAMQQARDQAAREAQQLNSPGQRQQQGEQSGEGRSGSDVDDPRNIPIPSREEFQTPEEYRRALLEGMEGDVPEQYRALKRRYYEELVHQ